MPAVALRLQSRPTSTRPTPSRSCSAKGPSPAAAACCSARRSPNGSPVCGPCRPGSTNARRARHPDWTGPDDLMIKIEELREATNWQEPIYVKVGATRVAYDVKLAVAAGADCRRRRRYARRNGRDASTCSSNTPAFRRSPPCGMASDALREIGKHGTGPADRLGRHPYRGRRRQGSGPRCRRRLDRGRLVDRPRLQPPGLVRRVGAGVGRRDGRLRRARHRGRVTVTTATPAAAPSA